MDIEHIIEHGKVFRKSSDNDNNNNKSTKVKTKAKKTTYIPRDRYSFGQAHFRTGPRSRKA